MSVCLSVCLSVCIYLSIYLSIYLYLSIHPSIIYLSIYLSITYQKLTTTLCVSLPIYLPTYQSTITEKSTVQPDNALSCNGGLWPGLAQERPPCGGTSLARAERREQPHDYVNIIFFSFTYSNFFLIQSNC